MTKFSSVRGGFGSFVIAIAALLILAQPGLAVDLFVDQGTGQVFVTPGDGRVPIESLPDGWAPGAEIPVSGVDAEAVPAEAVAADVDPASPVIPTPPAPTATSESAEAPRRTSRLKSNGSSLPDWLTHMRFSGAARVRYEWISGANPTPPDDQDRNRFRYFVRVGATFEHPNENLEVGVRLASSGNSNAQASATSQNVTADDAFRDDDLRIDRAYISYSPPIGGGFNLNLTGGKVANPYRSTRIPLDTDLSPEGLYARIEPEFLSSINFSAVSGYYVLEEENQGALQGFSAGQDAYLVANQIRGGVEDIGGSMDLDLYSSIYNYVHPSIITRAGANGNYGNNSTSGARYLGEFSIWDVGGRVRGDIAGLPASLEVQYLNNDGARANPVTNQVHDNALIIEGRLGKVRNAGDWEARLLWASVEQDALLAYFMDGDFGAGEGNSNYEGFRALLGYGVTDNSTFDIIYYNVQPENNLLQTTDPDQEVLQVDYSVKF